MKRWRSYFRNEVRRDVNDLSGEGHLCFAIVPPGGALERGQRGCQGSECQQDAEVENVWSRSTKEKAHGEHGQRRPGQRAFPEEIAPRRERYGGNGVRQQDQSQQASNDGAG